MLTVGTEVERYRIEAVLGRGGAGTVYAVRHRTLDTLHALKVLHISSPAMQHRFIEEGRIQARLRHPNVLPVSDVLDLHGHPALLMDFVDGGSLAERLLGGPMGPEEALHLARGVIRGVHHAHAARVLHRDLKPANVLLDQRDATDPIPRVTDFGLARVLGDSNPGLTRMGAMLGTPAYMAPEQVHAPSAVDERADIFSLGVILHELFTGERPFTGADHQEIFDAARAGDFPPLAARDPALPATLVTAIEGCLAPDREERIATCTDLLTALDGIEPEDFPSSILWRPVRRESSASLDASETPAAADTGGNNTFAAWLPGDDTPMADPVSRPPAHDDAGATLPPLSHTAEAPGPPPVLARDLAQTEAPHDNASATAEDVRPRPYRAVALRALVVVVPLLLALSGRLETTDASLRWGILRSTGQVVPADDIGIVGIATADMRALRQEHAGLLERLATIGVRAVVFDIAFTREGPEDAAIAAAIERLTAAGTPVVMPVRFEQGKALLPGSSVLRDAVRLGAVENPQDLATGQVDRVQTLRWQEDGSRLWSLPLAAAAAVLPEDESPEDSLDGIRLGGVDVPVSSGRMWLAPTTAAPVVRHDDLDRLSRLADRVVFIGSHGRDEDRVNTPGGTRWGVEVMAEATQLILSDAVPRRLPTPVDLLLVLIAAATSLLAGRRGLLAAAGTAAATLGMGVALVLSGHYVALLPLALAGAIGTWASAPWRHRR